MSITDWTLAQSFAAVARHGSLSAAARALNQSQPTLGRHINALEGDLGVALFRRVPKGLELTEAGAELLPHANAMADAAARMRMAAEGRATNLAGTVRITASVIMSHFILPDLIAELRRDFPQIEIELVPSDASENLLFREADIAVRMYRPEQLDIVTRLVGERKLGLYAATSYLAARGAPESFDALLEHDIIGFDRGDLDIRMLRQMGINVDRSFFRLRCDDQAAHWHLVCAGCGIGGMQCAIGDAEPKVERVMPSLALPTLPLWLAAPQALSRTPRMRIVWDFLAEGLAKPPPEGRSA
jgi:DNA-binding transcriptional LysR family regulator